MIPSQAGPHQEVNRVEHPKRGLGFLIRRNGPALWIGDDGAVVPMPSRMGGTSVQRGSWDVADDPEHGRVECRLIERLQGLADRKWHAMMGAGWLVHEVTKGKSCRARFELDSGVVYRFEWVSAWVGPPSRGRDLVSRRKKSKPLTPEEECWLSYESPSGEIVAFRNAPPPAEEQGDLF